MAKPSSVLRDDILTKHTIRCSTKFFTKLQTSKLYIYLLRLGLEVIMLDNVFYKLTELKMVHSFFSSWCCADFHN